MTGDTEREALIDTLVMTKLSDYAGQEMALINAAADRILAEFLPAHDKRVREQTLRDFLSYRMLPSDVREYVSEYVNAGREASGD